MADEVQSQMRAGLIASGFRVLAPEEVLTRPEFRHSREARALKLAQAATKRTAPTI